MTTDTPTLYAISAEHRRILEAIDANGGELTPELEAALTASSGSMAEKLDACHAWLAKRRLDRARDQAVADQIMQEAEPYLTRVRAADREMASLDAYMRQSIEAAGETQVDGRLTYCLQANPLSVKWTGSIEDAPKQFVRTSTTHEINKAALLKAKKAGEELPEQAVFTRTYRLVIK